MAQDSDKKIVLLYVLDVLKNFTDENHLLTYSDILTKLDIQYGITPNIKSIARNIETLSEYGYEIVKKGRMGCYLKTRNFNNSEVMYLVDAVFSSKSIPPQEAKELIKKIINNCSSFEKRKYKHIYKVDEISRMRNTQLFKNIEILNDAIEKGKKVSFQYNEYNANKQFLPRMQGRRFIMNPYFLVNNNGKYYLVCNYEKYNDLANYKIECISDLKILDEDIKKLNTLPGQENFKIDDYINEHIYMTHGNSVIAKLKLESEKVIGDIIDWYGENINVYQKDGAIYAELKVNEVALIYWALQYGEVIEIVCPEETRQKYKNMLTKISLKY